MSQLEKDEDFAFGEWERCVCTEKCTWWEK